MPWHLQIKILTRENTLIRNCFSGGKTKSLYYSTSCFQAVKTFKSSKPNNFHFSRIGICLLVCSSNRVPKLLLRNTQYRSDMELTDFNGKILLDFERRTQNLSHPHKLLRKLHIITGNQFIVLPGSCLAELPVITQQNTV